MVAINSSVSTGISALGRSELHVELLEAFALLLRFVIESAHVQDPMLHELFPVSPLV